MFNSGNKHEITGEFPSFTVGLRTLALQE